MESVENIEEGSKGKNIKLTIDLGFQDSVDEAVEKLFQIRISERWS